MLPGLVSVLGASQKEDHLGSKRPAPGTTTSTVENFSRAVFHMPSSSGQDATLVLWKKAPGFPEALGKGYSLSSSSASGWSLRSAMRTEQPFLSKIRTNSRLIPSEVG